MPIICSNCKKEIDEQSKFCKFCGHESNSVEVKAPAVSKTRIYLVSFFLSPLGLFWFFKYFRSEDPELKKVAYVSLLITVVTLILVAFTASYYVKALSKYIDIYGSNLEIYSELGY